jgi:lysophospholipase L1-like esterase
MLSSITVRSRPVTRACALAGLILSAACGHSMTGPSGPGPALACPAGQGATSTNGQAVVVSYPAPTVTGGTAPFNVGCLPASGSPFGPGSTTVTCSVADADKRASSCSFTVVVVVMLPPPVLSATRFVAFGDSLTESKFILPDGSDVLLDANSYPADLQNLLQARYATQSFTVLKRGCGGEPTSAPTPDHACPGGINRLPGVLAADTPQVLLLLEGANDIGSGDPGAIPTMISGLSTMVQQAHARGAMVFLATLPPERAGSHRGTGGAPLVEAATAQIRNLAPSVGATLVDVFAGLGGNPDPYVGDDGLHLTVDGYQKMAETFFEAIRTTLEVPPVAPLLASPAQSSRVRRR